jgi:hypothetical protein
MPAAAADASAGSMRARMLRNQPSDALGSVRSGLGQQGLMSVRGGDRQIGDREFSVAEREESALFSQTLLDELADPLSVTRNDESALGAAGVGGGAGGTNAAAAEGELGFLLDDAYAEEEATDDDEFDERALLDRSIDRSCRALCDWRERVCPSFAGERQSRVHSQ